MTVRRPRTDVQALIRMQQRRAPYHVLQLSDAESTSILRIKLHIPSVVKSLATNRVVQY